MKNPSSMRNRFGRRAAAATLIAGAIVGAAVTTAEAQIALPTDSVRIAAQNLDFGNDWFALTGAPLSGGHVHWTVSGGAVTAQLTHGNIYINNAPGTCGRMRLEGYDSNHNLVTSVNGGTVCASDGSLHRWSVNKSVSHADLTHVHVKLQVQNTNGSYSTTGTDFAWA